ncbi:hypothetical protein [Spiroplasma endosymbiont of Seladonia tumulorum]|uniref:hypothetical protein n=1 Tax=Spiroplasma endosymbiont of Seladonia tumulorum TaxID=3066321 RepID=UPI0030D3ECAE
MTEKKTTITKNAVSSTIKKNVTKKEIVEKKREWINKIIIDVKIYSDPIKTKIVSKTAGGVEIDAGFAGCSWSGMNYTTLSIYEPNLLLTFLKLRKDDEIRVTGSIWNTLNKVTKKYFHCIRVEKFEIIKKVPRTRSKNNQK